jgi:homoserine dehydrogenase
MKRAAFPFRINAICTRHKAAYDPKGLPVEPKFEASTISATDFIKNCKADVLIEITTLNPLNGEPAISHIRTAFEAGLHVITANKGPVAFAYAGLCRDAKARQVEFRFESTVMDGTPIFSKVRNNLPGVKVQGFTGALNSTSKVVIDALRAGSSFEDGIRHAQEMGIAEADASYDIDGWDSASKTAALANVLMDAETTPQAVKRSGIGGLTSQAIMALARERKTVLLVSRARTLPDGSLDLCVAPEILPDTELLATAKGTSNILLLHTDLMGTLGTISLDPGVEQTAYGLFSDLVDIARSL